MTRWRLEWRGKETAERVINEVLLPAMTEFGLAVEGAAKQELYPGHGVVTGTLRRSIHAASPGHKWVGNTGGPSGTAAVVGGEVSIEVGSGLEYARAVHDGHGSFQGYHYLTRGLEAVRGRLRDLLEKYSQRLK